MYAPVRNLKKYRILFFVCLFLAPITSRGFLFQETASQPHANYLKKSIDLQLGLEPQWIKLGHYAKQWFGHRSSFTNGLFIHPAGATSPQLELEATIELLYSNGESTRKFISTHNEHPQCYYLARTRWLNQRLHVLEKDRITCSDRIEWKKKLNAKSVSIIFASADLNNPASSFGHTFLKLNNPNNENSMELIDYGIDYSAEADASEGMLYAIKGLVGLYDGRFAMLPFHQKILEYTNIEGRDIWEYRLTLSEDEVDFLIDHLLEMERAKAPYLFFTDNCSLQILRTLEAIRPEMNIADQFGLFAIPIDTLKALMRHDRELVSEVKFRPSLSTKLNRSLKLLSQAEKNLVYQTVLDPPSELPKEESTQILPSSVDQSKILEAVIRILDIQIYKAEPEKREPIQAKRHSFLITRSKLGSQNTGSLSNELIENKNHLSQRPDLSHDSSAVSVGRTTKGSIFRFRSAFHELEQSETGLIPFSHTEIGSISLFHAEEKKRFYLERVTITDLMNFSPWEPIGRKKSWKMKFSFNSQLRPEFEGGLGFTYGHDDADRFRFAVLADAGLSHASNDDGSQTSRWSFGPSLHAIFRPVSVMGLSLAAKPCFVANQNCLKTIMLRSTLNLGQGFELQFQGLYENQDHYFDIGLPISENGFSYQAFLKFNFLL